MNPPLHEQMKTQPITARELRIGNLVFDDFDEISKVENIQSERFNEWNGAGPLLVIFSKLNKDDKGMYTCDVVSGIPLTPEWLERFGFEKRNIDRYVYFELKTGNTVFNFSGDVLSFGVQGVANVEWVEYNFNSVHQLQNLYFALTGEELKIEL